MAWLGWKEDKTRGVLVAGRAYDFGDYTCGDVRALCASIVKIGKRAGLPIVAVPVDQDLSENMADEDDAVCSIFVGVLAGEGGTLEPRAVPRKAMLSALEKAEAIPSEVWEEIDEAYLEAGGKDPDEEISLRLGCTGPLPSANLVFGVPGAEGTGLKGDFVCGQGPDQERHKKGVYGQQVAHCSYDGSPADPFEIDDDAHAERVEAFPSGEYYLIARFD